MGKLEDRIAGFVSKIEYKDIPKDVREYTNNVILDTIGVYARGCQTDYIRKAAPAPPILECEEAIQVGLQDVRISDLFGQVEAEEGVQWISKASRNQHPETDLTVPPPEQKPASPATVSAELLVNGWIDSPELYNNDRRFRALADLGRRAGHRENEVIMRQLAEDAQEFEFVFSSIRWYNT